MLKNVKSENRTYFSPEFKKKMKKLKKMKKMLKKRKK